jgi:CRP-like cAMP-binding protein
LFSAGKVELLTRKGQLISILRHGEFFGERGILENDSKCFTGAKAVTPVDAIKITKTDFLRLVFFRFLLFMSAVLYLALCNNPFL